MDLLPLEFDAFVGEVTQGCNDVCIITDKTRYIVCHAKQASDITYRVWRGSLFNCFDLSRVRGHSLCTEDHSKELNSRHVELAFVFAKSEVQLLETSQHWSIIMFLSIYSTDYDIITYVLNIWNVTYGRGNHSLKLFRSSANAKTETLVPE